MASSRKKNRPTILVVQEPPYPKSSLCSPFSDFCVGRVLVTAWHALNSHILKSLSVYGFSAVGVKSKKNTSSTVPIPSLTNAFRRSDPGWVTDVYKIKDSRRHERKEVEDQEHLYLAEVEASPSRCPCICQTPGSEHDSNSSFQIALLL